MERPQKFFPPPSTLTPNSQPLVSEEETNTNFYFPNVHNFFPDNFQGQNQKKLETNIRDNMDYEPSQIVPENSMDEAINVHKKKAKYSSLRVFGVAQEKKQEIAESNKI